MGPGASHSEPERVARLTWGQAWLGAGTYFADGKRQSPVFATLESESPWLGVATAEADRRQLTSHSEGRGAGARTAVDCGDDFETLVLVPNLFVLLTQSVGA